MATGPAWRSDLGSPSSLSEVASDPTHDQRIGPRRGKADNNRGPRGSLNGWLHAGGSHDVQSRITYAAHLQDEYPTATVPAAHRSALDGGVHTRLLGGNLDVVDTTRGRRNRSAILSHPFEVKFDCLADGALRFLNRCASRHAAGQIGYVGRVVRSGVLNDDGVSHGQLPYFFWPDCFRILFSVPGAKSSLGFPATVTRPGFVRCLNWRWLPRVPTRYQPSS